MALGIGCLGARLLYFTTYENKLAQQSRTWPSIPGCVTQSKIQCVTNKGTQTYWPYVTYCYVINGIRYNSSRIAFGQNGNGEELDTQHKVAQYPATSVVRVFYNPEYPSVACLEPGKVGPGTSFLQVIGLLIAGIMLIPLIGRITALLALRFLAKGKVKTVS